MTAAVRAAPVNIEIDANRRFQTIEGFGTCLYLYGNRPYDATWFHDLYARDLGCSIVRMELTPWVLGKDMGRPVALGEDLDADIKLMDFSEAGGLRAGTMIRSLDGRKLDRLLLIGSLWTPPDWMKWGSVIKGPNNNSSGGHLKMDAENLRQFGRYVAAYVKGFEKTYGVPFYGISIQNELMFAEPYNSCQYTPREYHDAIKAVGEAFKQYGITTRIMGPEGVGPDDGYFTGRQMEWINAVKNDPATAAYLNFFCIHGYGGNGRDLISDGKGLRDYWGQISKFGAESWMTESSGENPAWLHLDKNGDQDGALSLARHLHEGLVDGNYSAIVYWQCSDGKAAVSQYTLMAFTPESAAESGKFAVAKQFFRFIRPGAVRVACGPELATLGSSAFVNERDGTVTVEMVNMAEEEREIRLKVPLLPAIAEFEVCRSSETERCETLAKLKMESGAVDFVVPRESVVTLYGKAETKSP